MALRTREVQPLLLKDAGKSAKRSGDATLAAALHRIEILTNNVICDYYRPHLPPEAAVTGPKEMDRPPSGSMEQSAVIFSQLHPLECADVSQPFRRPQEKFLCSVPKSARSEHHRGQALLLTCPIHASIF